MATGAAITRASAAAAISVAGNPYYYSNGVYYAPQGGQYAVVENGYKVTPPPIGSSVTTLPNGAVDQNIKGATYFVFGGACYRPFYSGSSVIYEVVAKPA